MWGTRIQAYAGTVALATLCGAVGLACDEGTADTECAVRLAPGDDDQATVQAALIDALASDVICFSAGHYTLTGELTLTTPNVTLRGVGEAATDVELDWAAQQSGANGINATGDGFTIEHLSIANVRGDGVRVSGADGIVFRDLNVRWDAPDPATHGAYAVFPVQCTGVLVEQLDVSGAADAGVYIGQSRDVVVRDNHLHGNVDGISIENSTAVEVYGNHVHDNTGGIVVFNLPDLPVQDGKLVSIHDNEFVDNNGENFGPAGQIVEIVPPGTGMIVLAADDVEVRDNTFRNHKSAAIVVASYDSLPFTQDDPNYDAYPQRVGISGNRFENNGWEPEGILQLAGQAQLEDIVWDGVVDGAAAAQLCIWDNDGASYRYLDADGDFGDQHTDIAAHACMLEALPPVDAGQP